MHFKIPQSPAIPFQTPMRTALDLNSESKPVPASIPEKLAKAAMIRRSNLDSDVKAVALELQMSADGLDRTRLSNKALAELADLPVETVDAAIASLERQGLIRREMGGWAHIESENAWRAAGVFK